MRTPSPEYWLDRMARIPPRSMDEKFSLGRACLASGPVGLDGRFLPAPGLERRPPRREGGRIAGKGLKDAIKELKRAGKVTGLHALDGQV